MSQYVGEPAGPKKTEFQLVIVRRSKFEKPNSLCKRKKVRFLEQKTILFSELRTPALGLHNTHMRIQIWHTKDVPPPQILLWGGI